MHFKSYLVHMKTGFKQICLLTLYLSIYKICIESMINFENLYKSVVHLGVIFMGLTIQTL